jgi:hypothetical protein
MKKLLVLGVGIVILSIIMSCGGAQLPVSNSMRDFLDTSIRDRSFVTASEKYGFPPENLPPGINDLKGAIVEKVEQHDQQTLYIVNVTHDEQKDDYVITWDGDTIVGFDPYVPTE